MQKTHVLIIHGGNTFKSKKDYLNYLKTKDIDLDKKPRWTETYLAEKLGRKFQVIKPRMPLSDNAQYSDWKILFERYLPHLNKDYILIGHSLGGIFLTKYLSENKLNRKALSTFIICPPFDNTLSDEDLVGGFTLKSDLSLIEKNTKNLTFMFSKDDPVIPIEHAEKYRKKLPNAKFVFYKSKNGHFQVSTFPEIVKMIKGDVK